jgi:hypothetical protein
MIESLRNAACYLCLARQGCTLESHRQLEARDPRRSLSQPDRRVDLSRGAHFHPRIHMPIKDLFKRNWSSRNSTLAQPRSFVPVETSPRSYQNSHCLTFRPPTMSLTNTTLQLPILTNRPNSSYSVQATYKGLLPSAVAKHTVLHLHCQKHSSRLLPLSFSSGFCIISRALATNPRTHS